ncbi:MAG: hypothetical protein MJE66_24375 [Proteobacteria bacterium]|nr:hypothetical protein [Pseudomonadota bacterium]
MLERFRVFADALVSQARRHGLLGELIVVEWNPPSGPRLADALPLREHWSGFPVRYVEVPPELHRRFPNASEIPLFQMIAKNVGIRRARGRFVLATNPDLLFTEELIEFLASSELDENTLYRLDRIDVEADVPVDASVEEQLAWCRRNVIRIHTRWGSYHSGRVHLYGLDLWLRRRRESFRQSRFAEFLRHPHWGVLNPRWLRGRVADAGRLLAAFGRALHNAYRASDGFVRGLPSRRSLAEAIGRFAREGVDVRAVVRDVWRWVRGLPSPTSVLGSLGRTARRFPTVRSFADWCGRVSGHFREDTLSEFGRRIARHLDALYERVAERTWNFGVRWWRRLRAVARVLSRPVVWLASLGVRLFRLAWRGLRRVAGVVAVALGVLARVLNPWRIAEAYRSFVSRFQRRPLETLREDVGRPLFQFTRHALARTLAWPVFVAIRVLWTLQAALRPIPQVHTNGCGDFTLLSRRSWERLRGYPEMPIWSMHLDSLLCYMAVASGCRQRVLRRPARMYHIEHGRSWVALDVQDRLRTFGEKPWIDTALLAEVWESSLKTGEPVLYNDVDWGLAKETLPESLHGGEEAA